MRQQATPGPELFSQPGCGCAGSLALPHLIYLQTAAQCDVQTFRGRTSLRSMDAVHKWLLELGECSWEVQCAAAAAAAAIRVYLQASIAASQGETESDYTSAAHNPNAQSLIP